MMPRPLRAAGRLLALASGLVAFAWGEAAEAGAADASCRRPDRPHQQGLWMLALSWQPGFCESRAASGRPLPPSCARAPEPRPAFTLHGLWPQWAEYCGADANAVQAACRGARDVLDPLALPEPLTRRLAEVMPGTDQGLERHQWLKHGSCSGLVPAAYFATSVRLVAEVNATRLDDFLRQRMGQSVSFAELCGAIRDAFGEDAMMAVEWDQARLVQGGETRYILKELRLWLKPGASGRLTARAGGFAPISSDFVDPFGRRADPLCDDTPHYRLYIDRPGIGN